MRLELTGRHVTISPAIRKLVERELEHVLRLLNDSAVSGQVVLTAEKGRIHCDVTVHARGEKFLHGEASGRDVNAAVGAAVGKIHRQAQKLKGKRSEGKRRGGSAAKAAAARTRPERAARESGDAAPARFRDEDDGELRIIKARRYAVKPLTIDEAATQMGDGGDAFLVFRNAVTEEVAVLFRRPDGNLGLIEP